MCGAEVALAYDPAKLTIEESLSPILERVKLAYATHHPEELSLYVIGSAVYGNFRPSVSDLDVIGIINATNNIDEDADRARKADIFTLGTEYPDIAYIDNILLAENALLDLNLRSSADQMSGHLAKLALMGVCFSGKPIDFSPYIPSRQDMIFGRVERVKLLMDKYADGSLIEPFRQDSRLLVRSCAKAAMRVMSSITLLEGAAYHPAPSKILVDVGSKLPHLSGQAETIMRLIDEPDADIAGAFQLVYKALSSFAEYNDRHEQ